MKSSLPRWRSLMREEIGLDVEPFFSWISAVKKSKRERHLVKQMTAANIISVSDANSNANPQMLAASHKAKIMIGF